MHLLYARPQSHFSKSALLSTYLRLADMAELWLSAPEGKLCAREQAKAWTLPKFGVREVWRGEGKGEHGLLSFVAARIQKTKDGKPKGGAPCSNSITEFFRKVDSDPSWYPGKHSGERRGPKRVRSGIKVTAVVSAATRLKAEGEEPTYSAVVAACPKAALNPSTSEPVDKKLLYTVFRESCYDDEAHPEDTRDNHRRLAQSALEGAAMERRVVFANHMLGLRHSALWYYIAQHDNKA